ncbi:MAG: cupin domain-containing protein [Bdellovibrionota bacterium]
MRNDAAFFSQEYWGKIHSDEVGAHSISIFGFENVSSSNAAKTSFSAALHGTIWGFAQSGSAEIDGRGQKWNVSAGQWFCAVADGELKVRLTGDQTRLFGVFNGAHVGLPSMGGPVEKTGRLRYIDGCTDTILYSPPLKGDPCLNLLHFPSIVDQTQHFHPSSRCGIVSSGHGLCVFENEEIELVSGQIFYLPKDLRHKFRTGPTDVLDVISFHPDSDWGPTHEVHPMINRTWIDSKST